MQESVEARGGGDLQDDASEESKEDQRDAAIARLLGRGACRLCSVVCAACVHYEWRVIFF
jgi:hypothetical protein